MGGTKRMTKEEKRQTILSIYHKNKLVYTEKEIIQLATKEGVTSNTIAEINNGLIDDGLVEKAKIGGCNYFWSFPAKKEREMQLKLERTLETIKDMKVQVEDAKARLADAQRGREDDDGERSKKLARLNEIATEKKELEAELETLKENDPQAIADLEKELQFVKEGANRWTDNIFCCKDYLIKKQNLDKKRALRVLEISDDFDYPEDKIPA